MTLCFIPSGFGEIALAPALFALALGSCSVVANVGHDGANLVLLLVLLLLVLLLAN